MSAICGAIRTDGGPCTEPDLEGMRAVLAPLGGDGGGAWSGTADGLGVAVAAELRRRTPEDAAERGPAKDAEDSVVLVGDIRVDNRGDLASVLGVEDRTKVPDSAFVLAAYERWSEGFLDHVVGEMAIALVDRRRGGVLLARDDLGMRPLVIHERRGVVAFASNALALTGFEGVGHALDRERLIEVLALVYSSERTFVQGVRWLLPGSAMWIDGTGIRRWRWWAPDPNEVVDLGSPEAHERELREAFNVAVAAQVRSAGTVAAGTSGGLDSPSVAATAALALSPETLHTYTSVPAADWNGASRRNWDPDESDLVRLLAKRHPNLVPHFVTTPHDTGLFPDREELWGLGAGPGRNPCNELWIDGIARRARDDGAGVLLTGARGNAAFSADGPEWLIRLIASGRVVAAAHELAADGRATGRGQLRTAREALVTPVLPAAARTAYRRLRGRPSRADDWLRATAVRPEAAAILDLEARVPAIFGALNGRRALLRLLQAGASQADGAAARAALTGVESRDPTTDRRVLAVAMRQPEWVRRHDGSRRAVVRGAMADRLPPEIAERTRRGEQLPDWLEIMTAARGEVEAELEELRAHSLSAELIDVPRLQRLVANWPDRETRADPHVVRDYRLALWRALNVSRYARWFERRAVARAAS